MGAAHSIPGPLPFPLIGGRGNRRLFRRDPLGYVLRATAAHGPISALTAGDPRAVIVSGPPLMRGLLAAPEAFRPIAPDDPIAPFNLASLAYGAPPAVPPQQLHESLLLRELYDLTLTQIEALLDRWGIGQQADIIYVMTRLTRRIALALLLGPQAAEEPSLADLLERWSLARHGLLLQRPEPVLARLRSVLLQHYEVAGPGVRRLRAVAERQDASSLAVAALRVLAAQETTGLTLGWTVFLLSQHPRVLADVEQEIAHVCGNRAPTLADLDELRLLSRVLRETQRLFPPLAVGARITTAPVALGGYTLPAGATIIYSPVLNHRADTYVAPLRFRPERWLYLEPTPESFHPFGLGPDLWDGEPWATLQLKLILARMLQRYRLALAPHETIHRAPSPLFAPRNGIAMIIGFRDRPLIVREPRGNIRSLIYLR